MRHIFDMRHLLSLLILMNCYIIQEDLTFLIKLGVLEWTVIGNVKDYGQNVTLFCNVSNCCTEGSGWIRWTSENKTLFIDVKTEGIITGFDWKVLTDGYTLVIQNLTKQDLNVSYSCVYGVTLSERKFLLEKNVFTSSDRHSNAQTGNCKIPVDQIAGIIDGVIVLLAVAIVAVLFVFRFWKRRKKRNIGNEEMHIIAGEIGDDWMVIGIKLGYTRDMVSLLEEVYQRQPKRRNFMMITIWCSVISHLGWNVKQYLAKCLADAGHADIADTLGERFELNFNEPLEQRKHIGSIEWQTQSEILDIAGKIGHDWKDVGIKLGYTHVMLSHLEEVYPRQPKWRNFMMIAEWCDVISNLGWNVKLYLAKFLADSGHAEIADTLDTDYNIVVYSLSKISEHVKGISFDKPISKGMGVTDMAAVEEYLGRVFQRLELNLSAKSQQKSEYFLEDPSNIECTQGEDAMLTCKIRAKSPSVKWSKGGNALIPNEKYKMSNDGIEHKLILKNVDLSDSGEYCVEVGKASKKLQLKVIEIPSTFDKNSYLEAIKYGTEVRQYVRIQVIGKDRVGKTSLVRRLLGQDINNVESTDGIDINKTCQIRKSDGEWIVGKVEAEMDKIKERILRVVNIEGNEPVVDVRRPSEPDVLKTENTPNSRNSYEDRFHSTEGNEPPQLDKIKPDQFKDRTGTLDNIESENSNNQIYKKQNIEDTVSSRDHEQKLEQTETIETVKNANLVNSEKYDKITNAVINSMDDILLYVKNKQDNMTSADLVECGIWDFAGQRDYYATHQTFFTPHAIYVLVADITEDIKLIPDDGMLNFDTNGEYIDFWFDSIHCFREDTKESITNKPYPSVIMVCTGIDKVPDKDKEAKKKEYASNFITMFGCQEKGNHKRGEIHFISNLKSDKKDFETLKRHISEIAQETNYFAQNLPTKWIQLENAFVVLKELKEKEKAYCEKWEDIVKLAQEVSIENYELLRFLKYQHKIGNIIFFENKRDYIILQPKWLVDCFRCLVCDDNKNPCNATELFELKHKGIISMEIIDQLFGKVPELQFAKYKHHILDVMEEFDIIVKQENTNSYYMPCMVTGLSTVKHIKETLNVDNTFCTPWLVLEFKFLPISYFNFILVNYIRKYIVDGRPALYAGKAVVYLDQTDFRQLVICFSRNAISLQIWKRKDVGEDMYQNIIEDLCKKVDVLDRKLFHKLDYKIKAKCRNGDYSRRNDRISYEELTTKCEGGEYLCKEHNCIHKNTDLENIWLKHVPVIERKKRDKENKRREKIRREEEIIKGLPAEIRALDKDSAKVFTHLLEEESYPHFESRVMLVGEQGTGKTTIARYLIGKGPTKMGKSTDGIGLYTGLSYIDRDTEEWLECKQDFSLEELTISRSLRQNPLEIPTSSLSTGLPTDLSKQYTESLIAGASVQGNEQHIEFKEKNEMQDITVEAEKDNIRSREQGDWNNPIKRIEGDRPITNVLLDLHNQQGDPNNERPVSNVHLRPVKIRDDPSDEIQVQNVHLDLQEHEDQSLDKKLMQNVPLVGDIKEQRLVTCVQRPTPKVLQDDVPQQRDPYGSRTMASNQVSSSKQPCSDENTQYEEFKDKTYFENPTGNKSQEYKPNPGLPLVQGGTKNSNFPEDLIMHTGDEQLKTLTRLSKEEQATSGLTHSVESVTDPGIITKLKRFFGVSKEVKEIKISITEEHILKQSLKVGKKKLHQKHIAPVIIWDFGGQDIFYSTHQSFLSYRAIYLIVLDGSRTLDDQCQFEQYLPGKSGPKTARDYLQFWINTIVTYCKGSHHGFPKIMIVFTHKDKLKTGEVETTREQLFLEIKSMFQGSTLMSHLVIEDKIFVNARNKNDPEMAKIRRGIIRESKRQPTWGQNFPKCFIPLELEFENLIRENMNVITFDDLKKINTQHPIRPLSDAELKVFLKFQHAIGKILYFDEPGLDTHITLLPTYLIDAFKSIITDKQFCKGEKQKEHLWNLMSQKGVISKSAIEKLWRTGKYQRFDQHKDYLVAVMTHLDILVEPKRYDFKRNRIPTDFYFVASMVQAKDTNGYLQSPFLTDRNIAIAFSSNSAIIPPALSFRFITYCLSIFDVKKHGDRMDDDMLFHRSAVFTMDPSLEIHILCEDDRIFVRLVHAKNKVLILKDLASSICDCLKSALENISQLYIKTSSDNSELSVGTFEMNLCCSVAKDPCLLSIGEFNKIDSIWVCPGHRIDHEKYVMSSWITEKEIMKKCEITCPVTNEDFLREDLSAFHLRRLSILYDVDEIRELVTHLELPYIQWRDLFVAEPELQLLKFKALCLCHEKSTLTFRKIKKAVEEGKIQNPHTLCKVMRGAFMDFDTDPEKWDLVPSDEDIDRTAPLIGNKSLFFLVELGMDLKTWETINHRQTKRDLVKLNKDILDEWMLICKAKHVRPTMRMIAQAYTSIGKDIRVLENTLFN